MPETKDENNQLIVVTIDGKKYYFDKKLNTYSFCAEDPNDQK